jgi:hypothetical protein
MTNRRDFIGAMGAFALAGCSTTNDMNSGSAGKLIDTHHHFYAPEYQKAWLDWEAKRNIPHFQQQVGWSRAKAIEDLDKAGVSSGGFYPKGMNGTLKST